MNHRKMTQDPQLGPVLRAMREGTGLSLTDMAARVGVSKSTLSRFETGERVVSPDLLARITRAIADRIEEVRSAA